MLCFQCLEVLEDFLKIFHNLFDPLVVHVVFHKFVNFPFSFCS